MASRNPLRRYSLGFLTFVVIAVLEFWLGGLAVFGSGKDSAQPGMVVSHITGRSVSPAKVQDLQTSGGFSGVLTWQNDNARDGQNTNETLLTPANVNQTTFGVVFTRSVDGNLYAQPLYVPNVSVAGFGVKNVVYVATENDSVYAFDADGITSTPLWKTTFVNPTGGITPIPEAESQCTNISPWYGITGTPVIDPATGTLYVVTATKEHGTDLFKLHALDITSGKEKFKGPVTISPKGTVKFVASTQLQRPALLLANGNVYIGFGSHCDNEPYRGWLFAYNATTLAQTSVLLVTPNGKDGSLWNAGSGPAADASGNIFISTSNGTFDANVGGKDYGESILKLSPTLSVLDYFTPFNQSYLNTSDTEIGSAGLVLLPNQSGAHPHVLVTAGKEARIYVVDRDKLGHFHAGSDSQIVQSIQKAFLDEATTSGAYWNGNFYFGIAADVLKQYSVTAGLLSTTPVKKAADTIIYPGATPAISSNGTTNGIVWLVDGKLTGIELLAYEAADVSRKLYDSGGAVTAAPTKFSPPTVANGRVYVPTQNQLVVFGLL
jgi:hypothetical protein